MSRMQQVIAAPEAERADVQERLHWLDRQIKDFEGLHHQVVRRITSPPRSPPRCRAAPMPIDAT